MKAEPARTELRLHRNQVPVAEHLCRHGKRLLPDPYLVLQLGEVDDQAAADRRDRFDEPQEKVPLAPGELLPTGTLAADGGHAAADLDVRRHETQPVSLSVKGIEALDVGACAADVCHTSVEDRRETMDGLRRESTELRRRVEPLARKLGEQSGTQF